MLDYWKTFQASDWQNWQNQNWLDFRWEALFYEVGLSNSGNIIFFYDDLDER